MKFGPSIVAAFREMLRRAQAINHSTVWSSNCNSERCTIDGVEHGKIFIFFTADTQRAIKAMEVLESHGLLCHTDLGTLSFDERGKLIR